MGKFVKGDIIIIPFPFTDLSKNKKRPAFVVADLKRDDIIVCRQYGGLSSHFHIFLLAML